MTFVICRVEEMGFLSGLLNVLPFTSTLGQGNTNGCSDLGTLVFQQLPKYLPNNSAPYEIPWGQRNCTNTDPYREAPDTGVKRIYKFTISRNVLAPDGYEKSLILVNGQFPGPVIQANWGDTIVVNVRKNISDPIDGTSIHWHGFLQKRTQWMDVTSC